MKSKIKNERTAQPKTTRKAAELKSPNKAAAQSSGKSRKPQLPTKATTANAKGLAVASPIVRVGTYARVSTHDQQTLRLQTKQMREYVFHRDWSLVMEVKDVASGASVRAERERLMKAARRREIDVIIVWRLDRWGRSLADLVVTLKELGELGVGFVSLTEALDLTTPTGRAMAGMLAVFAEFEREIIRERVKAGIAQARLDGKPHGRPQTAALKVKDIKRLFKAGTSESEIARRLGIGRTSVKRLLD